MSGKTDTWMPFYIGDYLADTMHLTARQHGAYLLLLLYAWRNEGRIPTLPDVVRSIAKLNKREWDEDESVLRRFFLEDDQSPYHKRVRDELGKAQNNSDRRRKAGATGAAKRWQGDGKRIAKPSQNDGPSPSPSDSSVPNGTGATAPAREVIFTECLAWLTKRSGLDERTSRSVIGRWCRDFGDDAVLAALRQAEAEGPIDPIPWITAKFKPREPHETYEQRRIRLCREALQ